jgi:hypothetical protein
MERRLSPRFGPAATVLALVAVLAILIEVGAATAVAAIFLVWLGFAALELALARRPLPEPAAVVASADEERQPVAGAEPFAPAAAASPEEPQPLAASPFDEAEPPIRPALSLVPRWHDPDDDRSDVENRPA